MASIAEQLSLAVRNHQSGHLAEAQALYRAVLQAEPAHAGAHHLLGLLEHQAGRHDAALALIHQAIALSPGAAVFHLNLGIIHKSLGRPAEAAASLRRALALDPANADALCNLGVVLRELGEPDQAIDCYRQALRSNPRHAQAHNNLGNALQDEGRLAEAADCFRQALLADPGYANAHYNLGLVRKDLGQLAEACASFEEALRLQPGRVDAHNSLGAALVYLGRRAQARAHGEHALRLEPGNATALWNRALLRLVEGDLEGGWLDYEHRWTQPGFTPRHQDRPRWDGAPLHGKTILLHAEQGLGDTIQFIRYAALVKRRGSTVVCEVQPGLVPLLSGIAGVDELCAAGSALPAFDVQAPLLSLPGILGTTLANIPANIPYLRADPARVEHWRHVLAPVRGFKIGIAWRGSQAYQWDRYRSVPLAQFEALARLEGVQLVSLQIGPGAEETATFQARRSGAAGSQPAILELGDRLDAAGAFVDTAAVLMSLDLVVTVDTALTHLAGALGVPAWLALSALPEWRWFLDRADSPWYPTVRIFRQRQLGEWGEVFERIAAAARGVASSDTAQTP